MKTYFYAVANSFSQPVMYERRSLLAVVVPQLRQDGMYYEVNIKGFPRFYMSWSPLGRYEISDPDLKVPYELILSVSDAIEQNVSRSRK